MKACIFSLFLISCVKTLPSRNIQGDTPQIKTFGFSESQMLVIERTFALLQSLKAERLKIDPKTYKSLSRFEHLFGFSFDGKRLFEWVGKRTQTISYRKAWTVAINQNKGQITIGDRFFSKLTELERLYLLVHEARHSDGHGFKHVKCPKGFQFVSSGQPEMSLEGTLACDDTDDGSYAFQAAFLFELFAYGLFDQREAGLLYNSSILRILN
ncbi:MAG: hypothetical protein ACE5G1_14420 [bacterium]